MATRTSSSARHCAHCPEPGADVCIRADHSTGGPAIHIYAHRACAAERGEPSLYSFIDEGGTAPAAAR